MSKPKQAIAGGWGLGRNPESSFPLCPVDLAKREADFDLPCFSFACLPTEGGRLLAGGGGAVGVRRVSLASHCSDIQTVEFTAKMKPNTKNLQLL